MQLSWDVKLGEPVLGTAAIVGDYVYVPCLSGELACLDRKTGRRLWTYRTVKEVEPNSATTGFKSSPTITADTIYLGDEAGVFHAIDRATGQLRWSFKTDGEKFEMGSPVSAAPTIGEGVLVIGSAGSDGRVVCFGVSD